MTPDPLTLLPARSPLPLISSHLRLDGRDLKRRRMSSLCSAWMGKRSGTNCLERAGWEVDDEKWASGGGGLTAARRVGLREREELLTPSANASLHFSPVKMNRSKQLERKQKITRQKKRGEFMQNLAKSWSDLPKPSSASHLQESNCPEASLKESSHFHA